jgi:PKD repeat protein
VPNPEIVYGAPGRKKLYLRVGNCAGTRQITQYIDVYADLRPVQARFTFDPAEPRSLDPVTFTFENGDDVGNPNEFTIDFGDGTPPLTTTELAVQHAYGCSKLYRVSVTAKRIRPGSTVSSQAQTADVEVSGFPCSASGLVVVDMVRQVQRSSGVVERGDMVLFNPTDGMMELEMAVRNKDTGVLTTGLALPPLPPQGSMALADVAGLLGLDFSTATLWFERAEEGADTLPVVNAWKYLEPVTGVKYGQFLPVFPVWPSSDQTTTRWITGLVHNSLNSERGRYGYISKLTFVDPTITDPNRVPWGSKKLILRLYDNQTGQLLRIDSLNLDTFGGYRHDYLNRIFHLPDGQDLKAVTVQVEVPPGVSVIVTSAMYDNTTENAVVFPSQTGN